jgi:glycosyltransferase involved in cell wall biosynthesis
MRIGFFTESYFPEIDGVTYTIDSWKQRLEEKGHEVYVFYPDSKKYEPGQREIPVRSIPNPFYNGYNIPIPPVDIPDLDIVHCHGPATLCRYARRHAEKNNTPTVYTHHTPIEDYFEQGFKSKKLADLLSKVYLPVENRFLNSFDKVTASTPEIERNVEYENLPVGIDIQFFKPTESEMFEELERPLAGYSGRISNEKNVEELIQFADGFEGTLIVVGEGPKKKQVQKNAPGNVVFKDFLPREDLPKFYTAIDVFLTASTGDTLGLSTLEANACGTPVVAADVHPFDKTILEENGLRYEKGDIQDLRQKIDLCREKEFDTRAAVEKYSLKKTIENLEEIYRDLSNAD